MERFITKTPQTKRPGDKSMFDTAQILKGNEYDVTYVSSCLLHFSLFWVSVLGSVSELMTGKPPYMTKNTQISIQFIITELLHRYLSILYGSLEFWLAYWWIVGFFPHSSRQKLYSWTIYWLALKIFQHTYSAAETNLSRCPSFSSRTSRVRASPVDCRPITMHCLKWHGREAESQSVDFTQLVEHLKHTLHTFKY